PEFVCAVSRLSTQTRFSRTKILPLMLDTPARWAEFRLSAGSSLTLAALGVVFGDIGTSPLYAVRLSLIDFGDMSEHAILGALSLIVWALVLIVMVKYVLVIMRADNRGDGGLLALTALVLRRTNPAHKRYLWIMGAGLVGAALFYGDGVITPAHPLGGQSDPRFRAAYRCAVARFLHAGSGFPRRDRRRNPLRRYGAFWPECAPDGLDRARLPGAPAQLFRTGSGAARQSGCPRAPVLSPGARMGPLSAGRFGDGRDDHRLASGNLGRVLD